MTAAAFIASLRSRSTEDALGEIDGFTRARQKWGPPLSQDETEALSRAKAQLQAGRRLDP